MRVHWSLIGSLVLAGLIALAGCARQAWFGGEREPWRGEAELACLRSGAVREGPAIAVLKPINGPGMCGADYPLKVSILGEAPIAGYADETVRPPGTIPQVMEQRPYTPASAPYQPDATYAPAPDPYSQPAAPGAGSGAPLSLAPPYPGASPAPQYSAAPPSVPSPMPTGQVPRGMPVTRLAQASITPPATLTCPIVSALDRWISEAVQPAALHWFHQPVVEIRQISAYSCRGMNGDPNAHISEHAFGNALDVAAFTLADGHRISVKDGWHGMPEEQGFLHDVQLAACQQFSTVLAPGSNVYHYNHIHVDLMRRASGRRICEPVPMSGETAAARARARYAARRLDNVSVTGSIAPRRLPQPPTRIPYDQNDDDDLPLAIPGED
jgi:hypothetical protein